MSIRPTPPPPPAVNKQTEQITETRVYRLLTPLFGGGVDAGIPDLRQPISAKSIRGQLRFWWRATRAAQFKTIEEMKAFENWLWGCAATDRRKDDTKETRLAQSRVQIVVDVISQSKPEVVFDGFRASQGIPAYAAFPLQANTSQNKPAGSAIREISFQCKVFFPKVLLEKNLELEILAAFWAWETFGGIGARTRRGFGAFERSDSVVKDWQAHIEKGFNDFVVSDTAPTGIPQLSKDYKLIPIGWEKLILRYQRFRQGAGFARQAQSSLDSRRPGRTFWSEADEIRRITKQHLQNSVSTHTPTHTVKKFPRGQLGMPIIFQFKDSDKRNPNNPNADPRQTTLKPKNHERLSSPLILRPLSLNQSVVLILKSTGQPTQYELNNQIVALDVTPAEAAQIKPLEGQTDILKAVLEHLTKESV